MAVLWQRHDHPSGVTRAQSWQGAGVIARQDFTDEQWYRLRSAPFQVAEAVIEADPSGSLATGRELKAFEAELERVRYDPDENGLMRIIANSLKDDAAADTGVAPADLPEDGSLPDRVITVLGDLRGVLDATVEPDANAAFRAWLLQIATLTASAAKEGFAGVAGPAVSDAEQAFLDRLQGALGLD